MLSMGSKDSYVGDEGVSERSLIIKCPMENGLVINWDDMEKIWHHTFYNELRVVPEDRPVLLTESPFNPAPNRLKTTQIMFETFNTPSTYLADRATLALLASGTATTGVVLQIGDGAAYAVPVCAGHAICHAAQKISVTGGHITKYLSTLLEQESGVACSTSAEREILRDIKEKICYVAKNFETEMEISVSSSVLQKSYEMPSGEIISIGNPRFRCVEALFQPSFLGFDNDALSPQHAIFEAIMKCDVEMQEQLWGNIVVSGASTLFQGFADRLNQEISCLVPSGHTTNIVAPEFREFAPWMGGCIFAFSPAFESMCISKKEYDEFGPGIVSRKCV
jgi:actin-related protein